MINLDDLAALDSALRAAHSANAVLLVEADADETGVLAQVAGLLERAEARARLLRTVPSSKDERRARNDLYPGGDVIALPRKGAAPLATADATAHRS